MRLRNMEISRQADLESTIRRFEKRLEISRFAVEWLYQISFLMQKKKTCTRQSHPVLRSRASEPNKIKFPIPFQQT